MLLNLPHDLKKRTAVAVLVVWIGYFMFVKYNAGSQQWVFWIMYIPYMPCIPGHDSHVPVIFTYNLKVSWIQCFYIFLSKHLSLPLFYHFLGKSVDFCRSSWNSNSAFLWSQISIILFSVSYFAKKQI